MNTDHPQLPGDCAAIREEFSALLDDELSPSERARVEAHLADCSECLRALDGLKRVADLYEALPAVPAPADFEARVRAAVQPNVVSFPRRHARTLGLLALAAAGVVLIALPYALRESGTSAMQMASNKEEAKQAVAAKSAEAPGSTKDAPKAAELDERRREQLNALGYLHDDKISDDSAKGPAAAAAPAMSEAPKPKSLAAASPPAPSPAPSPVAREALPAPAAEPVQAPMPEAKPEPKPEPKPEAEAGPEPKPEHSPQWSAEAEPRRSSEKPSQRMPSLAAGAPAAPPASVEAKKESDNATPPGEAADAGAMQPHGIAGGAFGGGLAKREKAKTAESERADTKTKAAKADALSTWSAADRNFTREGAAWKETGYNGEAAKPLHADSKEFQRLLKAFPILKQLIDADIPVIFKSGTTWYKLLPKVK